jgi:AcrR family transcriptional regulator
VFSEQSRAPEPSSPEPYAPLPRGRHDFAPEVIARQQRDRIIAAVAQVMAERGYSGLTVARIIESARLSRTTFYEHFADKREAAIGAHEQIFGRFLVTVQDACRPQTEWTAKVEAAIGAILEFATAEPASAQLLAAGFLAADEALVRRVRPSYDQLAALLGSGREIYPRAALLPAVTEQALVGAIATTLARRLSATELEPLAGLHSQLTELTLIPFLGTEEAARAVGEA